MTIDAPTPGAEDAAFAPIKPHQKDLGGGFTVRRLLPAASRRAVGPFVFFDHFGPINAAPGDNHDVRPHPHIGLSTVTYLFEGAMMHRDSTGVVQRIEPGALNWMTAGRGIVHSERTPKDLLDRHRRTHGLQLWTALPAEHERVAPSFQHAAVADIPERRDDGVTVRVLVGRAFDLESPIRTWSPTLLVDLGFERGSGAEIVVPDAADERALYGPDEGFELDGSYVPPQTLVPLAPGRTPVLASPRGGHVVLLGGASVGPRFMVWNFVASDRERIREAEADWLAQRFDPVPGETEFIPLPERRV
ncbi:pirin family protein [Piscinibacter koreensis]|uniref:Pirin family protein n=1 Tax=Piscinibacter koreensis TaxID=2742824 RepID=A0A7Y6TXG6_9BURK|nr:pirin family protein [Schlegelella koreensis]NUZ07026.1 pirin family protein [Schlegelella koreensis]